MTEIFDIQRIAMHLVDRALDEPQYAKSEVDLDAFEKPDRKALHNFFAGHLERAWGAEEGERTLAAMLKKDSAVAEHFKLLKRDPSSFFERSKRLADLLLTEAKKRNTTRGLLVVLWFRQRGDRRPFLGLFKMDPGPSDLVTLPPDEDEAGQFLLQLVVEHVEQALPDPKAGVLKWAVLPHPTRPSYRVKLRDDEGEAEVALYFQEFLGCDPRPSPKKQAHGLYRGLRQYAETRHPDENFKEAVSVILECLKRHRSVNLEIVQKCLEESGLEGVSPAELLKYLRRAGFKDLDFPARSLITTRFKIRLENGIFISGPLTVRDEVEITGEPGSYEVLIKTPGYKES